MTSWVAIMQPVKEKKIFSPVRIIIAVFFLIPLLVCGQANIPLGQGILKINYQKLPTIHFYTDTLQQTPARSITVVKDQEGNYSIKNEKEVFKWFLPEQISFDYDIFMIRVDTVSGKWYKVIVNNDNGKTFWTKADNIKKLVKWPEFLLKETTSIDKGFANLDIKTSPSEKSARLKKIEREDCFEALEIKGDWMKIRTNQTLDCNGSKKPVRSGWIKWKLKNRLAIGYGLSC